MCMGPNAHWAQTGALRLGPVKNWGPYAAALLAGCLIRLLIHIMYKRSEKCTGSLSFRKVIMMD